MSYNNPIRSDDPDSIEKLTGKLTACRERQEHMKAVNDYFRKTGTINGCPDLSEQEYVKLKRRIAMRFVGSAVPYESVAVRLKPYAENASDDAFFDFSFNYGENLFGNLEEGYEIVYMSYACHCAVWDYISLHRQNHFEHLDGVILYLNYCRKHHITVNRLFRKCQYRGEDLLHLRKEGKPWR